MLRNSDATSFPVDVTVLYPDFKSTLLNKTHLIRTFVRINVFESVNMKD